MIRDRAFGIETEYGAHALPSTHAALAEALAHKPTSIDTADGQEKPLVWCNTFGSNGGRMYLDIGDHPEYSTPPVQELDELVACVRAGERLLYKALADTAATSPRIATFKINNRVLGQRRPDAWGRHENYQVDRRAFDPLLLGNAEKPGPHYQKLKFLAAHLATRTVYCGSGGLHNGEYLVGQKASQIQELASTTTVIVEAKPLLNLRDEPWADAEKYYRAHVVGCDPHMSAWQEKMSVGTTALIWGMIEDGVPLTPDIEMDEKDIPANTRLIARDQTGLALFTLSDGSHTNALTMQRTLLDKAKQWMSERAVPMTADESWILEHWNKALTDHQQDPMLLRDRVDWASRLHVLDGLVDKTNRKIAAGLPDYADRELVVFGDGSTEEWDLQFDTVGSQGSIGELLRQKPAWKQWGPPEALIRERMTTPPPGRARMIGEFILKHSGDSIKVDWDRVVTSGVDPANDKYTSSVIIIDDPRDTDYEGFWREVSRKFYPIMDASRARIQPEGNGHNEWYVL